MKLFLTVALFASASAFDLAKIKSMKDAKSMKDLGAKITTDLKLRKDRALQDDCPKYSAWWATWDITADFADYDAAKLKDACVESVDKTECAEDPADGITTCDYHLIVGIESK